MDGANKEQELLKLLKKLAIKRAEFVAHVKAAGKLKNPLNPEQKIRYAQMFDGNLEKGPAIAELPQTQRNKIIALQTSVGGAKAIRYYHALSGNLNTPSNQNTRAGLKNSSKINLRPHSLESLMPV